MKTFTKRLALVMGLLFTALMCLGIVYIDTTQNYWYVNGGFVKLIVSNQTAQAVMTVDTNTFRVGFNTNNTARSFVVQGQKPATNDTGNGATASTTGRIVIKGGSGGESATVSDASGGVAGALVLIGGDGGNALASSNNATGGAGGLFSVGGGTGGGASSVATNSITGGVGGAVVITSGLGGTPAFAATNTVGGSGGSFTATGADGVAPSAGWARRGGAGGTLNFAGGLGAASVRTNGGVGGSVTFAGGNGGANSTAPGDGGVGGPINFTAGNSGTAVAPGNPSPGAAINLTAGAGAAGGTNSDGGHVFIAGGAPGSGAVPGNVVLARTSAGTSRGAGVQVGPFISGGTATITNVLGGSASLDFPSTVAGAFSELTIAVTGVTSNNVAVSLSTPWQSAQTGGAFVTFNSNDVIYVRFINNQLVSAIDPSPGTFTVVGFRIR